MLRNAITAAAALALTAAPIVAQAAPAPRTATSLESADEMGDRRGIGIYIIGAIALGLIIWGIIELTGDDEPSSP